MFKEQTHLSNEFKLVLCNPLVLPLFVHSGNYNYQMVNASLISLRQYLEANISKKTTVRKIYSVLVECIENIYRHGHAIENDNGLKSVFGYVILGLLNNRFHIWSGNFIKNTEVDKLKEFLNTTIIANSDTLQDNYNYILNTGELSEKQGMGIGIIDIALRTKEPLKYKIVAADKNLSIFALEISVPNV
jgi:hypothetical protein